MCVCVCVCVYIYTSMVSIKVVTLPTVLFRKGARHPHSSGQ